MEANDIIQHFGSPLNFGLTGRAITSEHRHPRKSRPSKAERVAKRKAQRIARRVLRHS